MYFLTDVSKNTFPGLHTIPRLAPSVGADGNDGPSSYLNSPSNVKFDVGSPQLIAVVFNQNKL